MSVDWSKAPEGATHYADGGLGGVCVWYKDITATSCKCINFGGSKLWITSSNPPAFGAEPIPVKPWTGEGLPPVGTVCECHLPGELTKNYSWVEARVIWHNGPTECAVVRSTSKLAWCDEFRPIRTPEQIAADEREAEIEILRVLLSKVACDDYHAAVAVFEAGYRKQVES